MHSKVRYIKNKNKSATSLAIGGVWLVKQGPAVRLTSSAAFETKKLRSGLTSGLGWSAALRNFSACMHIMERRRLKREPHEADMGRVACLVPL